MAGDWIKVRVGLIDDPDVYVMSDLLSLEVPTIVGHLLTFWGWMDRHSVDGEGIKLTDSAIDNRIGVSGFSAALREVGWLDGEQMALFIPHWDRHNSASAKARSLEAEAKRIRRSMGKNESDEMSDKKPKKSRTREEKRREESKKELPNGSSKKKTARKKKLPDDFCLSEARRQAATEYWSGKQRPDLVPRATEIFEQFVNHHTANGSTMSDWDAAWRTWYFKTIKFERQNYASDSQDHRTKSQQADDAAREYLQSLN